MNALTTRQQGFIWLALALLMAATRGQHWGWFNPPSASWAVFFLGGILLGKARYFFAYLLLAAGLDISLVNFKEGITQWCVSSAYWALLPAYGSLWLGGRLYRHWQQNNWNTLAVLVACGAVSALVAYVWSGGGFYFASGRYAEPTLIGFAERIAFYYPRHLSNLAIYTGLATALYVIVMSTNKNSADEGVEQRG